MAKLLAGFEPCWVAVTRQVPCPTVTPPLKKAPNPCPIFHFCLFLNADTRAILHVMTVFR